MVEMTRAQRAAYEEAQQKIARARARGKTKLSFIGMKGLITLPPEIADFDTLKVLDLVGTQVTDLAPLSGLQTLQSLNLGGTEVTDLRPLLSLGPLWEKAGERLPPPLGNVMAGLWFKGTPATQADAHLKTLCEIADHKDRATQTRAYLQTLPPWPAPLPWEKAPEQPAPVASDDPTPAKTPGNKPAPLMVRVNDAGTLEEGTPPLDLEGAARDRARQAWDALRIYLDELAPLKAKIHNLMPNLGKALDSLSRALGDDFETVNQVNLGFQSMRVTLLSEDAGDYLMDQDPAELRAFAAALALNIRRFDEWEKYKDDAPPPPEARGYLAEDRSLLHELRRGLADEGSISEGVDAKLEDLTDTGTTGEATDLEVRATLDSTSNVLDGVAERALEEHERLKKEKPDLVADLNKRSGEAIQNKLLDSLPVSGPIWAITYLMRNDTALSRLAARYPDSFQFLTGILRYLCP